MTPKVWLVTEIEKTWVFEFKDGQMGMETMTGPSLALTNHYQVLRSENASDESVKRLEFVESFLQEHKPNMNVQKLVKLHRTDVLTSEGSISGINNLHSVIFQHATLDFWVAIDPPPAAKGKWVGVNLEAELSGRNYKSPVPAIIPSAESQQ